MQLVYYLVNRYYPSHSLDEDVKQEGMLGLVQAAHTFDESKSKFVTYAGRCILNQISKYFRTERKQPRAMSLEAKVPGEDLGEVSLKDIIIGDYDVVTLPTDLKAFYNTLDEREQKILELSSIFNTDEVAEILGKSKSTVWMANAKIRKKWRKFNGEDID